MQPVYIQYDSLPGGLLIDSGRIHVSHGRKPGKLPSTHPDICASLKAEIQHTYLPLSNSGWYRTPDLSLRSSISYH